MVVEGDCGSSESNHLSFVLWNLERGLKGGKGWKIAIARGEQKGGWCLCYIPHTFDY